MATTNAFEQQLQKAIEVIKQEIEAKQEQLAEAEKNYKDYTNNKSVVDRLMSLSGGTPPTGKRRGRKPKSDN